VAGRLRGQFVILYYYFVCERTFSGHEREAAILCFAAQRQSEPDRKENEARTSNYQKRAGAATAGGLAFQEGNGPIAGL
jgi:hypothetical protein